MPNADTPQEGALEAPRPDAPAKIRPKAEQFLWDARATHRAMEGWKRVRSPKHWAKIMKESAEEYESGRFLLERLGAHRHLDPKLMATLVALRRRLIAEWHVTTSAETMLVDVAVLSYYHSLRVNGWIGDLALRIEHEFFADGAFGEVVEMVRQTSRRRGRLLVEERVQRIAEQLMPLLDRANRTMIRNLKAIKELRHVQIPAIAIQAGHVNVANPFDKRLRPVKTELSRDRNGRIPLRAVEAPREPGRDAIATFPAAHAKAGAIPAVGASPNGRHRQQAASRPSQARRRS
jgi:hypothetical protein